VSVIVAVSLIDLEISVLLQKRQDRPVRSILISVVDVPFEVINDAVLDYNILAGPQVPGKNSEPQRYTQTYGLPPQ
jgi:hypothetical protein